MFLKSGRDILPEIDHSIILQEPAFDVVLVCIGYREQSLHSLIDLEGLLKVYLYLIPVIRHHPYLWFLRAK